MGGRCHGLKFTNRSRSGIMPRGRRCGWNWSICRSWAGGPSACGSTGAGRRRFRWAANPRCWRRCASGGWRIDGQGKGSVSSFQFLAKRRARSDASGRRALRRLPFVFSRHPRGLGRHSLVSGRHSLVFDRQTIPIGGHPLVFDRQTIPLRGHSRGFNRHPLWVRRLPRVARALVECSRRAVGHQRADAAGKFFPVKGNSCRV